MAERPVGESSVVRLGLFALAMASAFVLVAGSVLLLAETFSDPKPAAGEVRSVGRGAPAEQAPPAGPKG